MSDHLHESKQPEHMEHERHGEDFLQHGLVLPVKSLHSGDSDSVQPSLQEAFSFWLQHSQPQRIFSGAAFLLTNMNLEVIDAAANEEIGKLIPLTKGYSWKDPALGNHAFIECMASKTYGFVQFEEHEQQGLLLGSASYAASVYTETGECIGHIGIITYEKWNPDKLINFCMTWMNSFRNSTLLFVEKQENLVLKREQQKRELEVRKRDILFQAAKKLHAKIDVDSVLTEVIESMHSAYPNIQIDLFLTQDSESTSLQVKPLNFQTFEGDICTKAFINGFLIFEPAMPAGQSGAGGKIAAPLSGKQGVYGILYLQIEQQIDAADIQFISMLADTAGSAFENAKLYEQSNFLIDELRLINEITKRLNESLKLDEIFDFACSELPHIFGADYCCILQVDEDEEKLLLQASNAAAFSDEKLILDQEFSDFLFATREPIIVSDYGVHARGDMKLKALTRARSLIATPIKVNGHVGGMILVMHREPNYFTYDNYKLLQVLSGHIGLAIKNASLHAEVNRMVITDHLTGLYARHYLDEQANIRQKTDYCGSLIVVDIDDFKQVNDTHGHQVGDKVLIQVSCIIQTIIGKSDIAARWGGEELAIYLPQASNKYTQEIAEKIRARVMKETNPSVTVSCGISDWSCEEKKISVEALFYRADMALYQAKHGGRNQIKMG
ncbi:sensor domain-containing diguanylate cyclase [Paenibacillus eucommiae]|uniref:Diguanylate cyclase (GGDEF)-like protein n=1 Tax=Paenibacillus eucommiae TaxID=1355755 RepID=A0ABS4J9G4_9BACL|nr:sensor domain-containing diguanylate cyclase [Paenibacillus eucommiae]MBP1996484.1 diguanylate cyclase (GGDEF)-like protein [Paenibacillus eucommiae]